MKISQYRFGDTEQHADRMAQVQEALRVCFARLCDSMLDGPHKDERVSSTIAAMGHFLDDCKERLRVESVSLASMR